ncbi:MAG: hypothetical protein WC624_06115 [Candidatus Margulisiibacteriota bacterium]
MIEFLWATAIIDCSPGPYLELFARHKRKNWHQWGNEIETGPKTALNNQVIIIENKGISSDHIQIFNPSQHKEKSKCIAAK